jgi:ClpP class serine protease
VPNWKQILDEIQKNGSNFDIIRRKYIRRLSSLTKRNVIIYYSGWLQKPELARQGFNFGINDGDKNGFMTCICGLDRSRGLDLVLHTPGGEMAATEALVDYLRSMFGSDIRAIVPQIAMSGGTMIACACNSIVMGKHSSIGPIDPQLAGMPAHGIIEEFNRAKEEIAADHRTIPLWQPIIAKYSPTLIGECQKSMQWARALVGSWLETGMFRTDSAAKVKAQKIVEELSDHALTLSHARHYSLDAARKLGLAIEPLEDDDKLQDAVLSVHHAAIHTLTVTPSVKITENHNGISFINQVQLIPR